MVYSVRKEPLPLDGILTKAIPSAPAAHNRLFRDGIELAWERKATILQWALVAATLGVILRTLEERLGIFGRIIMRIIGVACTLACYFVVPVLAFEDLTPIDAVKRSANSSATWGEKVIGGFSLSLVSLVLMLPGIGLVDVAGVLGGSAGLLFGLAVMFLYFLLLSVFMSAVGGIFNAALYRYACFKQVPPAFSQELIASAWAAKSQPLTRWGGSQGPPITFHQSFVGKFSSEGPAHSRRAALPFPTYTKRRAGPL